MRESVWKREGKREIERMAFHSLLKDILLKIIFMLRLFNSLKCASKAAVPMCNKKCTRKTDIKVTVINNLLTLMCSVTSSWDTLILPHKHHKSVVSFKSASAIDQLLIWSGAFMTFSSVAALFTLNPLWRLLQIQKNKPHHTAVEIIHWIKCISGLCPVLPGYALDHLFPWPG